MTEFTLSQVLEMAIQREQDAFFFYTDLLNLVTEEAARETLKFVADEEMTHRRFLMDYKNQGPEMGILRSSHPIEYKLSEYIEKPEASPDMTSSEVYLTAAHRELLSHRFYSGLAEIHPQGKLHDMLLKMASEELKHKEKMEYLYSNTAFPQTDGG